MEENGKTRVYLSVDVHFDEYGCMFPRSITWENGKKYCVDRVSDILPSDAVKTEGAGDRYTIWINGKQHFIYFVRNAAAAGCCLGRWFAEKKTGGSPE